MRLRAGDNARPRWSRGSAAIAHGGSINAGVATAPGQLTLEARGHALTLTYQVPPTLPAAFVGVGVGPYHYLLRDGRQQADVVIPLVTVYAGYTFTPDVRIVYFNATAMHRRGYSDNGLYLWLEQARMVDDRLSFNLLLGANALVYSHQDKVEWRMTAPQGFELVYRDLFARNRSGMLGAFLYPDSSRRYYNVWLRGARRSSSASSTTSTGSQRTPAACNVEHERRPSRSGMPIARFCQLRSVGGERLVLEQAAQAGAGAGAEEDAHLAGLNLVCEAQALVDAVGDVADEVELVAGGQLEHAGERAVGLRGLVRHRVHRDAVVLVRRHVGVVE